MSQYLQCVYLLNILLVVSWLFDGHWFQPVLSALPYYLIPSPYHPVLPVSQGFLSVYYVVPVPFVLVWDIITHGSHHHSQLIIKVEHREVSNLQLVWSYKCSVFLACLKVLHTFNTAVSTSKGLIKANSNKPSCSQIHHFSHKGNLAPIPTL